MKECQQLGTLRDDSPGSELKNPGGERTGGMEFLPVKSESASPG